MKYLSWYHPVAVTHILSFPVRDALTPSLMAEVLEFAQTVTCTDLLIDLSQRNRLWPHVQLRQIFDAIRELMVPPAPTTKPRPIGFVTLHETPPKPKAAKAKK